MVVLLPHHSLLNNYKIHQEYVHGLSSHITNPRQPIGLTDKSVFDLTGNVNATSGLSTFFDVKVTRLLGVGVAADTNIPFKVNVAPGARFSVQGQGKIGLGTDTPRAGIDFADASGGDETKRFMVPPSLGTVGINSLTAIPAGAVIYNTATNKLQVYNGSAWQNCN